MRKDGMQAGYGLLGVFCVQLVGYFSAFFRDSEESWRGKSLERICRLPMNHSQAKVRIIAEICEKQNYGNAEQCVFCD